MSRLNTLFIHAENVRKFGSSGRGYIPNDLYERKIVPGCNRMNMDTLPVVKAMIVLIIDGGLNQCLD